MQVSKVFTGGIHGKGPLKVIADGDGGGQSSISTENIM